MKQIELRHNNRRHGCLACQKQYEFTIKALEKQIEILTEMLRMEHLTQKLTMPIPNVTVKRVKDGREK